MNYVVGISIYFALSAFGLLFVYCAGTLNHNIAVREGEDYYAP